MDLDKLYSEYFQVVYKFILKLSADHELSEDITQETFIKAIKNIKSFKGECKISVWLCQIAKNIYFSHTRKNARLKTVPIDETVEQPDEYDFTSKESLLEIHRLLHNLSEPYKEVFTLKTFADLSLAEISQLFGKSESWARVTYLRAKQKLQILIKESYYE